VRDEITDDITLTEKNKQFVKDMQERYLKMKRRSPVDRKV
jgi:hypothetical protein